MTPPVAVVPQAEETELGVPAELTSFRVYGVNTIKLLKRIEEEGIDVWLDEYSPPNSHTH